MQIISNQGGNIRSQGEVAPKECHNIFSGSRPEPDFGPNTQILNSPGPREEGHCNHTAKEYCNNL